MTKPLKAGGQALADGVLMRTELAWAIARADGSVQVGAVPPTRWARVPVLRVIVNLGVALKLGVVQGMLRKGDSSGSAVRQSRRLNRRFLQAALLGEIAVMLLARWLNASAAPHWLVRLSGVLPWLVVLLVLRVVTPAAQWRYHGAEHKAVTAHEQGVDLHDTTAVLACSRIHDRCGTNLVFVLGVAGFVLGRLPELVVAPAFLIMLGVTVEAMSVAARHPGAWASRLLLAGGKLLQRTVTTREPDAEEQAVGCRALLAALAEHERLEVPDRQRQLVAV